MQRASRLAVPDAEDTLAKAQSGDEAAVAQLIRTHQAMVFSLAVHVLGTRTTAEDVAQDVFVDMLRHLPGIASPDHLRFWLRRVTSHRCIDRMRRDPHRAEVPGDVLPERGLQPAPREVFLEARLRQLVRNLPPRPRMVVTLRYQEDLDPSEIAATLNVPLNTVKSDLRRSVAVLRARLLSPEAV
jgi:RNA polymerase sigma-70 factor (ECF subfamily)